MAAWRGKLRENGGAILQVHLSKTANDKLNALAFQWGMSKKDIVEIAIGQLNK
jgi:hypothetical protein